MISPIDLVLISALTYTFVNSLSLASKVFIAYRFTNDDKLLSVAFQVHLNVSPFFVLYSSEMCGCRNDTHTERPFS